MQFFSERRLKRDPKKSALRACGNGYPPPERLRKRMTHCAPAETDAPLRACGNGEPPPYQEKDTLHVAKKNIFGILATLKPANLRPKKICFHKICAH